MNNAHELRQALANNFAAIKSGDMDIAQAEAMTNIAGKMISSAIAQLKQSEHNNTPSDIAFLREPEGVEK